MNNEPPDSISKMPSVMRYDRVQSILEGDLALRNLLGPKDQQVIKRNGEKHFYSQGVVLVTLALHERGLDAHQVEKPRVLNLAAELLRDKPQKFKPELLKPEPFPAPPKPEPPAPPKPEPPAPPKPEPRKAKAKPDPKPQPKPEPKPRAKKEPKAKRPDPLPPVKAAVAPSRAEAPVAAAPAAVVEPVKGGSVYYIYGTALSLAVTLHRTLEIGDRTPGAEGRLEAVGKIIDELKGLANVGVPMPDDFNSAMRHGKNVAAPKG